MFADAHIDDYFALVHSVRVVNAVVAWTHPRGAAGGVHSYRLRSPESYTRTPREDIRVKQIKYYKLPPREGWTVLCLADSMRCSPKVRLDDPAHAIVYFRFLIWYFTNESINLWTTKLSENENNLFLFI